MEKSIGNTSMGATSENTVERAGATGSATDISSEKVLKSSDDGDRSAIPESFSAYRLRVWTLILLAAGLFTFLVYLSDTSLYRIRGLSDINLDIALMPTPLGMVNHLWLEANHWLKPAYSEPASRHGMFDDPSIRMAISGVWVFALALLFLGYRKRGSERAP